MRKQIQRAFTLVELLVVIGIIAVLIAILLPTLTKARQHAMLVKCAAQLRQVGLATAIYASENKGALPPTHREGIDPNWNLSANLQYIWVNFYNAGTVNPIEDPGANLGRLIRCKALAGTDANWMNNPILWCPAAPKDGTDKRDYLSSYYYNIHVKYATISVQGGGTKQVMERWWPKLANYGRVPSSPIQAKDNGGNLKIHQFLHMQYALASDPIYTLTYATHAVGRSRAWNLLYADGSVRTAVTDQRYDGRAVGHWGQFLDQLTYLEMLADGQQVQTPPKWGSYDFIPIDP